jgi:hypothetical protein
MFNSGRNTNQGTHLLDTAAIPTVMGYVQTDQIKAYVLAVRPASKAMPDRGAISSQGNNSTSQKTNMTIR